MSPLVLLGLRQSGTFPQLLFYDIDSAMNTIFPPLEECLFGVSLLFLHETRGGDLQLEQHGRGILEDPVFGKYAAKNFLPGFLSFFFFFLNCKNLFMFCVSLNHISVHMPTLSLETWRGLLWPGRSLF